MTGAVRKTIKVPGSKPIRLACHPTKGPLFVTTDSYAVLTINPKTGRRELDSRPGQLSGCGPGQWRVPLHRHSETDPANAGLQAGPGNRCALTFPNQSELVPGEVRHPEHGSQAAGNESRRRSVNGQELAVSPDGKKVAMVGGGGVPGRNGKRVYAIPFYEPRTLILGSAR